MARVVCAYHKNGELAEADTPIDLIRSDETPDEVLVRKAESHLRSGWKVKRSERKLHAWKTYPEFPYRKDRYFHIEE